MSTVGVSLMEILCGGGSQLCRTDGKLQSMHQAASICSI